MDTIKIKQERAAALKRAEELHKTAATEKRDLTAAERRDFERALAEAQQCAGQLERDAEIRAALGHAGRGGDGMATGGTDGEMRAWFANEFRDMASGSFGGALVPLDYQSKIWDRLVPMAVALKTGPTIISTDRKTISLPALTADAASGWVAEAGTISETDPTGQTITVTPQKVAALSKVSREFADDSNPGVVDMLLANLQRSIALSVDLGFFQGTGTSNQPTGLANTAGITVDSTTMGANGSAPTNLDFILSNLGVLNGANVDMSKVVIVMHSRTWTELTKLKDSQNRYLLNAVQNGNAPAYSIDGVPVFISNQLSTTETQGTSNAASSVYLYDASQVIVVRRETMRLETTKDAFFSTDQIGVRAISRVGFAVPNPASVVRIKGVL